MFLDAVNERAAKLEAVQDYLNNDGKATLKVCRRIIWLEAFVDNATELLQAVTDDEALEPEEVSAAWVVMHALERAAAEETEMEE